MLNKDGFKPGQQVSHSELQKALSEQRKKNNVQSKPSTSKRRTKKANSQTGVLPPATEKES